MDHSSLLSARPIVAGILTLCAAGATAILYRRWRLPSVSIEKRLSTGEHLRVRAGVGRDSHTVHSMVKRLAQFERMPEAVEVSCGGANG